MRRGDDWRKGADAGPWGRVAETSQELELVRYLKVLRHHHGFDKLDTLDLWTCTSLF